MCEGGRGTGQREGHVTHHTLQARGKIKACEDVLMRAELKGMRRVLRRLGHISEDGVIQNKGRVACEASLGVGVGREV